MKSKISNFANLLNLSLRFYHSYTAHILLNKITLHLVLNEDSLILYRPNRRAPNDLFSLYFLNKTILCRTFRF